jgi:hypothetical protein
MSACSPHRTSRPINRIVEPPGPLISKPLSLYEIAG